MKVWVTRDEPADGPLCIALRKRGLNAIWDPVLSRRIFPEALDVLARLGRDDWLVLTSPYAIEAVDCDAARIPKVAVVAEASRIKAEETGLRVEMVSPHGNAESLFNELRSKASGCKVCYPRSAQVPFREGWEGIEWTSPVLYETVPRAFDRNIIQAVDVAAVMSPSAVRAIGARTLKYASIGPTTSKAVQELGMEPWVEAEVPSVESLADAIAMKRSHK